MSGVNKAIIVGRLGQDPEVRTTQSGAKVVSLSVATSEQWRDKNSGEKKERTEWHRVTIWGAGPDNDGLAGVAEKYLKKGHNVYLSGKIQTREWEKDGIKRYTTEIVLQGFGAELVLLENSGSNRPPPAESPHDYSNSSSRPGKGSGAPASVGFDSDDIPFLMEWR